MISETTRQAIEQALGDTTPTPDELLDLPATARQWYEMLSNLEGTPGWEEPLSFTADDLVSYLSDRYASKVEIRVAGFLESTTCSRDLETAARTLGRKIGGYKNCTLTNIEPLGDGLFRAQLVRHDRHGEHVEAPVQFRYVS